MGRTFQHGIIVPDLFFPRRRVAVRDLPITIGSDFANSVLPGRRQAASAARRASIANGFDMTWTCLKRSGIDIVSP